MKRRPFPYHLPTMASRLDTASTSPVPRLGAPFFLLCLLLALALLGGAL